MVAVAIGMLVLANGLWYWTGHRILSIGIPATLLVAAALTAEQTLRIPEARLLRRIGDSSYSIYLSHTFVLSGLGVLWSWIHVRSGIVDFLAYLVALAAASVVGFVSWKLLEVRSFRSVR
jgi:exopolysaccharide production protein ExoZ